MMQIYGRVDSAVESCKETIFNYLKIVCEKKSDRKRTNEALKQANEYQRR
jgi:hypothetical protein